MSETQLFINFWMDTRILILNSRYIWVEVLVRGISPPQGGIPTHNELLFGGYY